MRVQIPLNGISTSSSYKDGDCLVLSNLRKKNGVLKPVTPRKIIKTLKNKYTHIFVHQLPATGENYICVRDNALYHVKNEGLSTETETLLTTVSGFKNITQIGNILNILDENGLQYVIWYESSYKLINSNFGGLQTDTELNPIKVDFMVDGVYDNGLKIFNGGLLHYETLEEMVSAEQTRKDIAKGLFIKSENLLNKNGFSTGFFLACYAFKLYDGTYIFASQPVLCGQPFDTGQRYEQTINSVIRKYNDRSLVFTFPAIHDNFGVFYEDKYNEGTESYNYDAEQRAAYYATSSLAYTVKYPDCVSYFGEIAGGSDAITCNRRANLLKFKVNNAITEAYRNLISSVCVFITPSVNMFDYETGYEIERMHIFNSSPGSEAVQYENIFPKTKTDAEIIEELKTKQQFYKVHEVDFDELTTITPDTWITIDLKGKIGENLINQEELPVDNSHHAVIPAGQFVYNSKLHVWNYKQQLFRPWPVNYFYVPDEGLGQFLPTVGTEVDAQGNIEYISVKLKTESGISETYRTKQQTDIISIWNLTGMLSYPDSRAIELTIYRSYYSLIDEDYFEQKQTFKLTASEYQNFAYYISPDLKPINLTAGTMVNSQQPMITEQNRVLIYENALKVSSLNNPFVFPATNTLQIGTGKILNASTNALKMSEGQFGQYDLFVFTTEGIYSLDTGTTISYNRKSPASLEIPISEIICSTPFGVIFQGKRGLFIINGQRVDLITPQIEEEKADITISYPATINQIPLTFPDEYFNLEIRGMLYDNKNNELIVLTTGDNYIISFDNKEIFTTTEKIDSVVENVYPEINFIVNSSVTKVLDYFEEGNNKQTVTIVTRPFNFGTNDKKTLERTILRATIYNAFDLKTAIFRSFDGLLFNLVQGLNLNGNIKGIDLGLLQIKSNQFIYVLKGEMETESKISSLDVEIRDDLNNTKLR